MTDDGSQPVEPWCPSCHTPVGDAVICPGCGLAGQDRHEAAELRHVVARIHEATVQQNDLEHELVHLRNQRHELFGRLRMPDTERPRAEAPSGLPDHRGEWRPERVRDVLLWLGAILLVIAAVTFAAVAWTRVGPSGRAGILLGVTAASAALTVFVRRRLRPTAEALGAITIALALVDWGVAGGTALRGDLSGAAWWAIGLLLVAAVCAATANRIDLDVVRLGATALTPIAAVSALGAWRPGPAVTVVVLAAITTGVVVMRAALRGAWTRVRPWLSVLAAFGEVAVVVGAVGYAVDQWAGADRAGAALAVLAIAVAPLAAALVASAERLDPAAATATLSLLGAGVVLLSGAVSVPWLFAWLAVGALGAAIGARVLPLSVRDGVVGAALLAAIPPTLATAPNVAAAWLAPIGWLRDPWTGSLDLAVQGHLGFSSTAAVHDVGATFVVFGCVATLAWLCTARRRGIDRILVPGVLAAFGLAVGIAAADITIGTALVVELVAVALTATAAIVADRRASGSPVPIAILVLAAVVALPAIGWAAVSPRASLFALACLVGLGGAGAVAFRTVWLRGAGTAVAAGAGLATSAVVLSERDVGALTTAFVVVAAGIAMLVAGRLVPWRTRAAAVGLTLEAVGCVGAAVGIAAIGDAPSWRLLAFALTAVGLMLAVRRDDERSTGYATAAVVAGGLAGIAGLASGRVASEWITLPAALAAAVIALIPRFPVRSSWLRFGPALLLTFVTSVGLAVDDGGWRVAFVLGAASLVLVLGARARLSAPIVVASVALLVLAVDAAAPYAVALPRWLLIGCAGAVALWAGATADRRLDQLRRWRNAIDQLS